MRKTNSLVFFLNPSKKKEKGARSLEISTRARALCLTANAKKREGKKRSKSIAYLYLHAFVCFLFARVLFSFFLRVFCLRALGFDDILSSFPFPKRRYFSIFLLFLRRNCAKGGNGNEKEGTRRRKERGCFFSFFGGKDLFVVFCPKAHRHESSRSL